MTIQERVKLLMGNLPYLHKTSGGVAGFEKRLTAEFEQARAEAMEEAAKVAESTYACVCGKHWTDRNRHSPDCAQAVGCEIACNILALQDATPAPLPAAEQGDGGGG
jgi:hypothetical protein